MVLKGCDRPRLSIADLEGQRVQVVFYPHGQAYVFVGGATAILTREMAGRLGSELTEWAAQGTTCVDCRYWWRLCIRELPVCHHADGEKFQGILGCANFRGLEFGE